MSFSPQPVSRVSSFRMPWRMPLARRDAQRFEALSRRPTRWPATRATPSGKAAPSSRAMSFGISAGGFWPSPSRVQIARPRAKPTPLWIAADWPALVGWRIRRTWGWACAEREDAGGGVVGRAVVDVDDLVGHEVGAGRGDARGDETDVLGLVLERHDDRQPRGLGAIGLGRIGLWCHADTCTAAAWPASTRKWRAGRAGNPCRLGGTPAAAWPVWTIVMISTASSDRR